MRYRMYVKTKTKSTTAARQKSTIRPPLKSERRLIGWAMKSSPELIEPGLSMFSAVRHLERIADHATNIAEDVVYLVQGEIIRHRASLSSSRSAR